MRERSIGVLCCSLLIGETRRALDRLDWGEVPVAAVPGQCHTAGPTQKFEWDTALEQLLAGADTVLAICMNCIHRPGNHTLNGHRLALLDHPEVRVTHTATQGELFMGGEAADALLSERAFMVLPGWLQIWRRVVFDVWAFDEVSAREFYQESSSRLVFLDTGVEGPWEAEMEAFSQAAGLPWERRLVGTSCLEMRMTLEIERLQNERLARARDESLRQARTAAADREVLVDFVTRLGDVLDGPAIRAQLRETLEMLFAPEAVVEEDLGIAAPGATAQTRSACVSVIDDGRSLDLALILGDGSRIRFLVRNLAFAEHMDLYLPLARITADAATLALDAARLHLREKDLVSALQDKVKELDSFVYSASHDLQSPLRSVVAFSELLARDLGDDLSEDGRIYLGFITKGATRMRALIMSLLALSRTERHALKLEDVSLDACVEGALESLAIPIQEAEAMVERAPLPRVRADAALITQLYQNLIGNAVKFRAPGVAPRITLTAAVASDEVTLRVADNGIGIDEKFAEHIFAPFRRLHLDSEYEGSGIGLSICRKVVERHGGRLWVEPSPGGGACFCFTLRRGAGDPPGDASRR
jgi:signal transduction histidine kinase